MSRLEIVVGGQYGSEGKGAISAWRSRPDQVGNGTLLAIRVAGPNAGHTVIGDRGTDTTGSVAPNLCEPIVDGSHDDRVNAKGIRIDRFAWRLRSVPVAAVVNSSAVLALAPGSEIDLEVLANEMAALDAAGYDASERLIVDPEATLISGRHKEAETGADQVLPQGVDVKSLAVRIGSTGKGIGAARADRLWRRPGIRLGDNDEAMATLAGLGATVSDTAMVATGMLRHEPGRVLIEGTQGYGLGLHAGAYPYCTSSDCRAIDFLAMAGISPWQYANGSDGLNGDGLTPGGSPELTIWVCLRPYPIRVGGNSGPMLNETSWAELGLPEEHTTVTGKVRRVGGWDGSLARQAIRANGGPSPAVKVAMTMMDTIVPEIAGWTGRWPANIDDADDSIRKINTRLGEEIDWMSRECRSRIAAVGTGPDSVLSLVDAE